MPVFRTEKVSDYAVIAKHHLKNRALSYKAKGLMAFMLSLPDFWDFSMTGLATLSSDGIDGVRSGINELEKHGYLTRRRLRNTDGRLGDIEYTIHEIPQTPSNGEQTEPPKKPQDAPVEPTLDFPTLAKPTQVLPTQALPTQENPTERNNKKALSINELSNNELNNNQQTERLSVKKADGVVHATNPAKTFVDEQAEKQFEQFWQAYPRKASKKAAKKAWLSVKPDDVLFSRIMAALDNAKQYWQIHGTSPKHIPHPSTWLNEERWEDEFTAEQLTLTAQSSSANIANIPNNGGGVHNATVGASYTIGGADDPYRTLMQ